MRRFTILATLVLLVLAGRTMAQETSRHSFRISPAKDTNAIALLNGITIIDIFQENVDSVPISLGWRTLEIALPPEWDYSMCELGRCYAGIPDSSQMDDVPPQEKAFLGVNIIPNGVSGKGTVKCVVFDVRYPEVRDTLTWMVTAATASVNSVSDRILPTLMPNPSSGVVAVELGRFVNGKVHLFDPSGKEVQSYFVHGSQLQLDLTNFAAGAYTMVADDRSILPQRIIKR